MKEAKETEQKPKAELLLAYELGNWYPYETCTLLINGKFVKEAQDKFRVKEEGIQKFLNILQNRRITEYEIVNGARMKSIDDFYRQHVGYKRINTEEVDDDRIKTLREMLGGELTEVEGVKHEPKARAEVLLGRKPDFHYYESHYALFIDGKFEEATEAGHHIPVSTLGGYAAKMAKKGITEYEIINGERVMYRCNNTRVHTGEMCDSSVKEIKEIIDKKLGK